MARIISDDGSLADRVRQAFTTHDLDAFGLLLTDDVSWGDEHHPRGCTNRADVLRTFRGLLASGVDGGITELLTGPAGILCGLRVEWPDHETRPGDHDIYHVYLVRDGRIAQIRRYDDRVSAAEAAGVS